MDLDVAAVIAAVGGPSGMSQPVTLEFLLTSFVGFEYAELTSDGDQTRACVEYDGEPGSNFDRYMTALAHAGVTGKVEFRAPDCAVWRAVLQLGAFRYERATVYFPGGADVVTLTRAEVQSLLLLVVGQQDDGLGRIVGKLTKSLG